MSDDLPTPERLGRIERGVQRRIDRRRQVAQQIAGASVAVLLVVGGVALARPLLLSSSGGGASSAGGAPAAGTSAEETTVLCHDASATRTVQAHGALPAAAIAACAAAGPTAASARPGDVAATPSPSPTSVLCESSEGTLEVYLGDASTCATHDLHRFPG